MERKKNKNKIKIRDVNVGEWGERIFKKKNEERDVDWDYELRVKDLERKNREEKKMRKRNIWIGSREGGMRINDLEKERERKKNER